jgi:protein tyrosine phosphatase (PTP) superfamily phosphohydrolase (DUF442 family)
MLTEITNFIQLTEDVGTSGQPTAAQFEEIAAHGYAAVINLALPSSDHAIAQEGSIVTSLGMSYLHIPVRFEQPTVDALRIFIGFMQALEGRKVWVHCVVNARVSAFMYLYLKHVKGFEDHAARSPLLERWAPQMDDVWKAFLALDSAHVLA